MRSLVKTVNSLNGVLALRNVLVSLTFFVDYFRGLSVVSANFIRLGLFFFVSKGYYLGIIIAKVVNQNDLSQILSGIRSASFIVGFFNSGSPSCVRVRKN